MKHKSSKRSISNKNAQPKRSSSLSTSIIDSTTISHNVVDFGTGTVHLDSYAPCLRPNLISKSQKALKRDLLRCSDQRPSLLGSQTLQPRRIHHGSQQTPTILSSSADRQHLVRRRSISFNSRVFYSTIDRIGPWPDMSIGRLRSDGNDLLRPLKNFRNVKNPRLFSPKYYAALNENTSKFKFYPATRTYIDEYRKQKGYTLDINKLPKTNPISLSKFDFQQQSDDEQLSTTGTFITAITDETSNTIKDRIPLSTTDFSSTQNAVIKSTNDKFEHINTSPSIPAVTKVYNEPHINNLPTIPMRNSHLRPARHPLNHAIVTKQSQHPQIMKLPTLAGSSLHYISSMNSVEKVYSNSKKQSTHTASKLFFIDKQTKKKFSQRFNSDHELATRSIDFSELRATGGSIGIIKQRSTGVVIYQLPQRGHIISTTQSDVGAAS